MQVYENIVTQLEGGDGSQAGAANGGSGGGASTSGREGPLASVLPPDQVAIAWIQYMRFCRRSESVNAARKVRDGWVDGGVMMVVLVMVVVVGMEQPSHPCYISSIL